MISSLDFAVPPRPSDHWLENPGWIDGATNPAIMYHTHEELLRTLRHWAPESPHIPDLEARIQRMHAQAQDRVRRPHHHPHESPHPVNRHLEVHPDAYVEPAAEPVQPTETGVRGRLQQSQPKKRPVGKPVDMHLASLSRAEIIGKAYAAHHLEGTYRVGVEVGPGIRILYAGSGSKSTAPLIETDADLRSVLTPLFAKKSRVQVTLELDVDHLGAFRLANPATAPNQVDNGSVAGGNVAVHGTKVPTLGGMPIESILHGDIILALMKEWKCDNAEHAGENGCPGYCYRDALGNHIGLNFPRFRVWAAGIASHQYTLKHPPPTQEFDGAHVGRSGPKARGRGTATAAPVPAAPPPTSSAMSEAVMGLLAKELLDDRRRRRRHDDSDNDGSSPPRPSRKRQRHSSPQIIDIPSSPFVPDTSAADMLDVCLSDFKTRYNINFDNFREVLLEAEYTPDIMCDVGLESLKAIISAPPGQIIKFCKFCKHWTKHVQERKETKKEIDD
ncbi:hypothetical protein CYLTODRAFT_349638 [Cylindrobasidium torrendii FP15055 ss-10]|uniref:Uncharacterized protein n=1 Tax=Cylindrobasidium torrendii FP15055 ss-10 TaxID=1314674 RepID=A0A0D7BFV2_9AGAR|nr:hypothetical protein CYLTODRAFT_349638 [Cylindrobasidium torrendii FP15055 ss-10]